jgi:2-polyprenyl-3-methyl-5-hydroxy-6-metoxy-1,4-benzoquinol methylase
VDCDACGSPCHEGLAAWHFVCPACGTEQSTLAICINDAETARRIDEGRRAEGLAAVRAEGYRMILDELAAVPGLGRGSLLEVGSAHGWFLSAAASQFERVVGVEPDDGARTRPPLPNVAVRAAFFPAAVAVDETFDVIAFNDVFEHIPDTRSITRAIAAHLAPGGVALISLPVVHGFVYRTSKRLARLGFAAPFQRLWQFGYPSPHLYYFSRRGLTRLFDAAGLALVQVRPLRTLKIHGLWQRIRYGEHRLPMAVGSYAAALAMAPVLGMLPADTAAFFFRHAG